ncbi:MAG: SDR family oxidoreductase [Saprospiraceae bacterium]|nr:SDR family oxidoreductase [Saprospiraceae bacterium]
MNEKYAVVTGATKGLGRAIAEKLAGRAYNLFIGGRNEEELHAMQVYLADTYGIKANGYLADLSRKEKVSEFAETALSWCKTIDVLVNNAGLYLPGDVSTEEDGRLEKLMDTNLYSAYHLTRALLPRILQTPNAHIFNMCSIASKQAYPGGGSYSISKFALLGFNKALREELKDKGIKVTAILPGAAWSDSWKGADLPQDRLMEANDVAEALVATLNLSNAACMEEIILRPQLGDL